MEFIMLEGTHNLVLPLRFFPIFLIILEIRLGPSSPPLPAILYKFQRAS